MRTFYLLVFSTILVFSGCRDEDKEQTFAIWTVADDEQTVEMNGEIETGMLDDWIDMVAEYPGINRINIKECGGSGDDEMNLLLGREVYKQNVHIHIESNGLVASGGTDFFLAGRTRSMGSGAMIGVHSWAAGNTSAAELDESDPEHQSYIDYYQALGFSETWSSAFYFFTINAAGPTDMHYMTSAEIEEWSMLAP